MKRIGSVFGFPVYAQPMFLLLIALYVLPNARSLAGLSTGLIAATIVTLSILLHELGHAIAFRIFGERNATIVLWGLGGLTYGRRPPRAWQNIVVSLAGPFVGFVVGMVSLFARIALGAGLDPRIGDVLDRLVFINIAWTFFNLLPLHPMDGGQAFRTLLVAWKGNAGLKASLYVSIVTGVLVALAGWRLGQTFVLILAAMMLLRNVGELRGQGATVPPAPEE
jgi:Zn-dependent protease